MDAERNLGTQISTWNLNSDFSRAQKSRELNSSVLELELHLATHEPLCQSPTILATSSSSIPDLILLHRVVILLPSPDRVQLVISTLLSVFLVSTSGWA